MEKITDLISRHKLLAAICFLAAVIIVILLYVFFNLFVGGNDKYGNRLDGIEEVEITTDKKSDVQKKLEAMEEVTSASVRVQGKIIYINIKFQTTTTLDKAKEIANSTLENFSSEELSFYDVGFYLTQETDENATTQGFVVTGSKNANLSDISWIKS